ncbi:hypothetical protein MELA_00838 [Candidatus Methylomirabilis lanthanidiphila]|uniref:Uncharacterized protein n=1 Tax=Candidatus Methylomirabilis lanthanidiphila TaxID=2211376 RepID=A0A564ZGN5_9BACT|nr:hypothetical protein [Candidatus Methylomirabilis lanthanidiphila]VUZ84465.1 hypothetical protein MELA_00838 [Candidatus Methylomirabilis lanthanidiphila]
MAKENLKTILECEFRSNPAYEIVEIERMNAAEKSALHQLRDDHDAFGILRPRENSSLSIKAICKDTALLFFSLQSAGRLPAYLLRSLDERGNQHIAELVLDGILQISRDDRFVSGLDARDLIYNQVAVPENLSRIARLSTEALKFAQRLPIDDPMRLSAQLYFFNRVPVTPRLQRRLGGEAAYLEFLGIHDQGACGKLLKKHWKKSVDSPEMLGWQSWGLRKSRGMRQRQTYDYKIYVSPALDAVPEMLPQVVAVFTQMEIKRFKFGADLAGLARPDKIVAYLESYEQVEAVGRALGEQLGDVPVHGVPFTADLCGDGLISWGMDPHERRVFDWQETASWRLWITNHLARGLLTARSSAQSDIEPWQFALERLRFEGIDTDTWTPMAAYEHKISQG